MSDTFNKECYSLREKCNLSRNVIYLDPGGQVMSGVSKNVDIVIAGADAGSKLEKAQVTFRSQRNTSLGFELRIIILYRDIT